MIAMSILVSDAKNRLSALIAAPPMASARPAAAPPLAA
jgi:hypothetical protein